MSCSSAISSQGAIFYHRLLQGTEHFHPQQKLPHSFSGSRRCTLARAVSRGSPTHRHQHSGFSPQWQKPPRITWCSIGVATPAHATEKYRALTHPSKHASSSTVSLSTQCYTTCPLVPCNTTFCAFRQQLMHSSTSWGAIRCLASASPKYTTHHLWWLLHRDGKHNTYLVAPKWCELQPPATLKKTWCTTSALVRGALWKIKIKSFPKPGHGSLNTPVRSARKQPKQRDPQLHLVVERNVYHVAKKNHSIKLQYAPKIKIETTDSYSDINVKKIY